MNDAIKKTFTLFSRKFETTFYATKYGAESQAPQ
jgi:hypothetical protein